MAKKTFLDLSGLNRFLDNLKDIFASKTHTHTKSQITDYVIDSSLSSTSTNPVQNKVINEEFEAISNAFSVYEASLNDKANTNHNHDDKYYTESEIDSKLSGKSDSTHNHNSAYDAKGAADTALASAKTYADSAATTAANKVKNDLLNGAGTAYDTLKELGDLIVDNADAIDALETIASGKADAEHDHEIADVTGLQSALDGKAASSHGTHVSYSTTAPVMDGTASVGSATTVARSDHKHPTDTSRAAAADLTSHTGNKSNPHGVTKAQVGLGNVENKSSATIRGELTKANVTDALGYTPPTTDTVYTHPTTSGNKHIPSGGSSGQILRWSADGTAIWGDDNNTTYTLPTANASTKGGVTLNDSYTSTSGASSGVAATPLAVKNAYDALSGEIGIEITQAAYNALSDSQKNSGTYYITDGTLVENDPSMKLLSQKITIINTALPFTIVIDDAAQTINFIDR